MLRPGFNVRSAAGPCLKEIAAMAADVDRRGWAEANAGNFSIRLAPVSGATTLLMKRAGARMRDIARSPLAGLCLVVIGPDGRAARVHPAGAVPTSELPAHLAAHAAAGRRGARAVLHVHPTATIALSLLISRPSGLVGMLERMHSEGPASIRDRVAVAGFAAPSSARLARATASGLRRASAVIWPLHGVIATGPDLAAALDLVQIIDKAATIALLAGARRATAGLTPTQMRRVLRAAAPDR